MFYRFRLNIVRNGFSPRPLRVSIFSPFPYCTNSQSTTKVPLHDNSIFGKEKGLKFLVTGGSGFIGSKLCKILLQEGHDVTIVTRNKSKTSKTFQSSGDKLTLTDSIPNLPTSSSFDIIINLAGESLTLHRWTQTRKEKLFSSRIGITNQILSFLEKVEKKPRVLVSGSAVGYYGAMVGDQRVDLTEESEPMEIESFSHNLCKQWEQTALKAGKSHPNLRVVLLRTGIVLDRSGGMISQLLLPFQLGLGGKIGTGKQILPWIHMEDLLGILGHVISDPGVRGPVNATAPNPVTNLEFTKTMGSVLRRPTVIPLGSGLVKLMFGEMGNELLLTGGRVVPKKILERGYQFKFEGLEDALREILGKKDKA